MIYTIIVSIYNLNNIKIEVENMGYIISSFLEYKWDIKIAMIAMSIIVVIIILASIFLLLFKKRSDIWKYYMLPGMVSIVVVLGILVAYGLYPDSKILTQLVSGEVIVGIAIVTPTLFTWLKVDKEKREEIERNLLREEYVKWLDVFSNEESEKIDLVMRVKLDALLSRSEKVKDSVIDYLSLFVVIQKKLYTEEESADSKEWRRINTTILKNIKSKNPEKFKNLQESVLPSESMKKLKYINFEDEISSKLQLFAFCPDDFEYSNCIFCYKKIPENTKFFSTGKSKFSNCIFDDLEKFEALFNKNSIDYTIDYYYLKETIDSGVYDKIIHKNTSRDGNTMVLSEEKELELYEYKFEEPRKELELDEFKTGNFGEEDKQKRHCPILSRQQLDEKELELYEYKFEEPRKELELDEFKTGNFGEEDKQKRHCPTLSRQQLDEKELELYESKSEQSKKEGSKAELSKEKREEEEGSKAELPKEKREEEEGSKAELPKEKKEEKEGSKAELSKEKREEEKVSYSKQVKEESGQVYDRRNFGLNKPIDSYLESEKVYSINIEETNANERINDKIKKMIGEKITNTKLDLKKEVIISRSLSYIPPSIYNKDSYKWYAYNTLDKKAIKDNIEYVIFAVQSDPTNNKKFECLVFSMKQFKALYGNEFQNIQGSSKERWNFIFTKYLKK